jgi:hypothetical protein
MWRFLFQWTEKVGVFGRFDLAALAQSHLNFVCLFDLLQFLIVVMCCSAAVFNSCDVLLLLLLCCRRASSASA